MKQKVTLLFLATLTASYIYAQDTSGADSISNLNSIPLHEIPSLPDVESPANIDMETVGGIHTSATLTGVKPLVSGMDIELSPSDLYRGVPLEQNLWSFPYSNDYSVGSGMLFSRKLWLSTYSAHNTMPGIGAVRTLNMSLNYQPWDWAVFSGGAFGEKSNYFFERFNDMGFTGRAKFILNDRVRFNAFGQYSLTANGNFGNAPYLPPGMFSQTYFGGSMEFRITRHFGLEGGIIRELNPFTGKWTNRPYVAPVFYGD